MFPISRIVRFEASLNRMNFPVFARSVRPRTTEHCACNTGKDNKGWNSLNTWMLWRHSFVWLMQTDVQRCGVMGSTSLVSTRSLCAVLGSMVRSVTQPCRQRVNDMKETWLEQHFHTTDNNSKLTEQHHVGWKLTFVSGFDHCNVLITWRRNTINITHDLPTICPKSTTIDSVWYPGGLTTNSWILVIRPWSSSTAPCGIPWILRSILNGFSSSTAGFPSDALVLFREKFPCA